jgi:predicted DCC family thiol-disulfide oxidoreductase YuxK
MLPMSRQTIVRMSASSRVASSTRSFGSSFRAHRLMIDTTTNENNKNSKRTMTMAFSVFRSNRENEICSERRTKYSDQKKKKRAIVRDASFSTAATDRYELKLLFDGDCPLCVKEVKFLDTRNEKGLIMFVDLADPMYSPEANGNISFEEGMKSIHGIDNKGNVFTGVRVFEKAYSLVGLGFVYSFTKVPVLLTIADKVYDVWAKYRLEITGRPSLKDVLKARRMLVEEKTCEEATGGDCKI